ncbi:MAG: hypothetical protein ACJ797_09110 [Ktedonobacteraceae bacterium]
MENSYPARFALRVYHTVKVVFLALPPMPHRSFLDARWNGCGYSLTFYCLLAILSPLVNYQEASEAELVL